MFVSFGRYDVNLLFSSAMAPVKVWAVVGRAVEPIFVLIDEMDEFALVIAVADATASFTVTLVVLFPSSWTRYFDPPAAPVGSVLI